VSAGFFRVFGLAVTSGRDFTRDDELGQDFVIVSDRFSRTSVGHLENLTIDGRHFRVVGIAPPHLSFPNSTDVWMVRSRVRHRASVTLASGLPGRPPLPLRAGYIGLVRSSSSIPQVREQLMSLLATANATRGRETGRRYGDVIDVIPLVDILARGIRPVLSVLLGATMLLLLLACGSASLYVVSIHSERRQEAAIRLALGATPRHLAVDIARRTATLGLACGLAAGATVALGQPILNTILMSFGLAFEHGLGFAVGVIGVATAIGISVGLVTGVMALVLAFGDISRTTRSRNAAGSSRTFRQAVATAAIAASFLITTGSVATAFAYFRASNVDLGYAVDDVARFRVSPMRPNGSTQLPQPGLDELLAKLGIIGGVSSTAIADSFPLQNHERSFRQVKHGEQALMAALSYVSETFPETVGIGKTQDALNGSQTVIVNRALVAALGSQINVGSMLQSGKGSALQIVAIVADTRALDEPAAVPQIYLPLSNQPAESSALGATVLVRCRGGCREEFLEQAVATVESERFMLLGGAPVGEELARVLAPQRATALVWTLYALLTTAVSFVGVIGIVRGQATSRRVEIATRLALGSSRAGVVRLLAASSLGCAVLGVAIGAALYTVLARSAESLIAVDLRVSSVVLIGLAVVYCALSTVVSMIPAWHLAKHEPRTLFVEVSQ
jgi:putative ABC transport system permease protein